MGAIILKQFDGSAVSPRDDAILYNAIIKNNGIFKGVEITHLGAGQLKIGEGTGIIKGRLFEFEEQIINCELGSNEGLKGRLYLRMELSAIDNPIQIKSVAAETLPDLVQEEDCNYTNGTYEMELCTYDVSDIALSNLKITYGVIENVADILKTWEEIMANTAEGKLVDALMIKELNNGLTASNGEKFRYGITEDGKYGYIVTGEDGADTVIPFKRSPVLIGKFSGNKAIDIASYYSDYAALTADNFMVEILSWKTGVAWSSWNLTVTKNYDASTGKLTLTNLTKSDNYTDNDGNAHQYTHSITYNVILIT